MFITMQTVLVLGVLAALATVAPAVPLAARTTGAADEGPQLAHTVYFQLKDNSAGARDRLIDACNLHLTRHEGTVSFATGTVADDFRRAVNDRDWDVSLHLVFVDKAAHDRYQDHPRHQKFVAENKDDWAKVRVFDAYLAPASAAPSSH